MIDLPGDGATDVGPILQWAYDHGEDVRYPLEGACLVETPVFVDGGALGGLVAHGNRARLVPSPKLPTSSWPRGLGTRFVFYPNTLRTALVDGVVNVSDATRATGSGGALRSLVVRDLTLDGGGGDYGLSYANRTAVTLENVTVSGARVGATGWSYADGNTFLNCYSRGVAGGLASQVIYEQFQNGDGVQFVGGKADSSVSFARLKLCRGATFSSIVTGRIELDTCSGVTIGGTHQEGQQSTRTMLTVRASDVVVHGSVLYANWSDTVPTISVDDPAECGSRVTLRDVTAVQLAKDGAVFSALVQLVNMGAGTRLRFDGVRGAQASTVTNGQLRPGPAARVVGPAAVQAFLDSGAGRALVESGSFTLTGTGIS